jgi:hypothetical protein
MACPGRLVHRGASSRGVARRDEPGQASETVLRSGGRHRAIPGLGRCGARAGASQAPSRAAPGLRPGSLRTPARSWLMRAGGTQVVPGETQDRLRKARPGAGRRTPRGAPRGAAPFAKGRAVTRKGRQPFPKGAAWLGAARRSAPLMLRGGRRKRAYPAPTKEYGQLRMAVWTHQCLMMCSVRAIEESIKDGDGGCDGFTALGARWAGLRSRRRRP